MKHNARNTMNTTNVRIASPANGNRAVLFPAKLAEVQKLKKAIVQILVGFYLLHNLCCKSNLIFNNFTFYGVSATAWQRASGIRRRRWRL